MKLLALVLATAFAMPVLAAEEAPKTKKACVTQVDPKTKKEKEVCKTIKVHKKHEGTAVEGATKDAKAPAKK